MERSERAGRYADALRALDQWWADHGLGASAHSAGGDHQEEWARFHRLISLFPQAMQADGEQDLLHEAETIGKWFADQGRALSALHLYVEATQFLLERILAPVSKDPSLLLSESLAFARVRGKTLVAIAEGNAAGRREARDLEQQALLERSVRDSLTNLYNRRYFESRLEEELLRAKRYRHPLSILLLDIDYFKLYNDTAGHLFGDQVLRAVSAAISGVVRSTDFAARFGGDEFVLVLPETPKTSAAVVAERVRSVIAEHPFARMDAQPLRRITVSVGYSGYPEDGEESLGLIRAVDIALYEAKHLGRNRVVGYTPDLRMPGELAEPFDFAQDRPSP
jgi:diguanylate cyclase (GGDEF)-like protein